MARYDNTLAAFTCTKCKTFRPRADFRFYDKKGYHCRSGACKDCEHEQQRTYYRVPVRRKPRSRRRYAGRIDPILGEVKRCTICVAEKPIEQFQLTVSRGKKRHVTFCNPCRLKYKRAFRRGIILEPEPLTTKTCNYCGQSKPLEQFYRAGQRKAHTAQCLECHSCKHPERWTQLSSEHRERIVKNRRQSALKSAEKRRAQKAATLCGEIDYEAIYERDKGICYICGQKPVGSQISFDHVRPLSKGGHHVSNNLRIACMPCNSRKGTRLPHEIYTYMPLLALPEL